MNREILFRGKRKDNGKWVEGFYSQFHNRPMTDEPNSHQIFELIDEGVKLAGSCIGGYWHIVEAETVGQYTGLTDKNGKRIFEGDIVEGQCRSSWGGRLQRCVIAYGRDCFEARKYISYNGGERYYTYKVLFSRDVVVIGNIHDNPELLKGGEV